MLRRHQLRLQTALLEGVEYENLVLHFRYRGVKVFVVVVWEMGL